MPVQIEEAENSNGIEQCNRLLQGMQIKETNLSIMENNFKTDADISRDTGTFNDYNIASELTSCQIFENILPSFCNGERDENLSACAPSEKSLERKSVALLKLVDINKNCNHTPSCNNKIVCLKRPLQLFEKNCNPDYKLSDEMKVYTNKTALELESFSKKELQLLAEDLTHYVEQVSSDLVTLLLENDALQQESDARNVAIEQLLKITVKHTETELRPIQMSIVLPSEDCDQI